MGKATARVLVVDSQGASSSILRRLQATGRYEFACTEDPRAFQTFLRWEPTVVLLHLPEEKGAADDAFDCLDALKDELPVVVMSEAADMSLYLVAMTRGAFDYFTSYTPLDEVMQVLSAAVRWQHPRAA